MKSIASIVFGVLSFLVISASLIWFFSRDEKKATEITLDHINTMIDKRELRESVFKQTMVEVTTITGEKFYAKLGSDPTREVLINKINKYNDANTSAPIKYTEEEASSGWGWIILINGFGSFFFYFMWAATLAVIIYAVRTLSRNKS